jgi:cytochrome c oxidase subunit 4
VKTDATQNDSSSTGHARPNRQVFLFVFLMLCGLTAISFGIANSTLMENRAVAWSAMIAISIAKATLVALFFMHLWWEKAWKYVLTLPALIMAAMLVLLLVPDIALRTQTYSKQRQQVAPSAMVDHSHELREE